MTTLTDHHPIKRSPVSHTDSESNSTDEALELEAGWDELKEQP